MSKSFVHRGGAIVACAGLAVSSLSATAGQVLAEWTNASSGTWNIAANWTTTPNLPGAFPNNDTPMGETYHAVIDATGSNYTVTLNSAVTIDELTLNSANATLSHVSNTLTVLGDATLSAGTFVLNGGTVMGGTWTESGGVMSFGSSNSNILDGVTLVGSGQFTLNAARARLRNGASITGDVTLNATNSVLAFEYSGSIVNGQTVIFGSGVSGSKFLSVEGDETLTIDAGATVRGRNGVIRGNLFASGTQTLVNNGLISADFVNSAITVQSTLENFTNNGVMEAINGATIAIESPTWTNSATGTLRVIGANSTLDLDGAWTNLGAIVITNGTMNLDGTFTTAAMNVGGWTRTGGVVNIEGELDNTGENFVLDANTGAIRLNGGTITGGTVTETGAALEFSGSNNNALDGVLVDGTGDFTQGSARVRLRNGAGFTDDVTLTATNAALAYEQTGSIASGRSVIFDSSTTGTKILSIEGDNTLTIENGATVRGRNGQIRGNVFVGGAQTLINSGLISADFANSAVTIMSSIENFTNHGVAEAANGATMTIDALTWTNAAAGTLRVTGASSELVLDNAWSSPGAIEITDGTLTLDGAFTTAGMNMAGWTRSGGVVNVEGALDNTGDTITLTAATGPLRMNGGVITGGTIVENGASLEMASNNNSALDGTIVQGSGDFTQSSARVRLRNGAGFTGDVTLSATNAALAFEYTGSLASGRSVIFDDTTVGAKILTVEGNNTLTIENGATVRGRNGQIRGNIFVSGSQHLVNDGLISADFANSTITIGPTLDSFTNNGVAEATNGGRLLVDAQTWTNGATGTMRVNAGSEVTFARNWTSLGAVEITDGTLLLDGTFTTAGMNVGGWTRNGGEVNIKGALNNAGDNLVITGATGPIRLDSGSITGGTVTENGAALVFSGSNGNVLDGVTVDGTGDFTEGGARARLRNGATFTGDVTLTATNAVLSYEYTGSIASGRTITFDLATAGGKTISVDNGSTLTIENGATVRGRNGTIRGGVFGAGTHTVVNDGLVLAEGNGQLEITTLDTFVNNGTLAAQSGGRLVMDLDAPFALSGRVEARAGGVVDFRDGLTIPEGGGVLEVQLGGALGANYGQIDISAPTAINGSDITVTTVNGFTPDWGDAFTILTFDAGEVTGDFSTFVLPTLTDAVNWRWYTAEDSMSVTIGVRHTADVNRDNMINFADLNILLSNYNMAGDPMMGDVDEDGFVGFSDLNRVLSFFNTSAPPNAVPAPGTAALGALLALSALRRRR